MQCGRQRVKAIETCNPKLTVNFKCFLHDMSEARQIRSHDMNRPETTEDICIRCVIHPGDGHSFGSDKEAKGDAKFMVKLGGIIAIREKITLGKP
ncbi:hypothetical protein V6N11_065104 [Hibiscus sabdariffa]|uniref:Uncharacterized protein n=1 Tax=Hibiscus sabdariffa TaxID=183260 RepID=A0ABR2SJS6_9ROSI